MAGPISDPLGVSCVADGGSNGKDVVLPMSEPGSPAVNGGDESCVATLGAVEAAKPSAVAVTSSEFSELGNPEVGTRPSVVLGAEKVGPTTGDRILSSVVFRPSDDSLAASSELVGIIGLEARLGIDMGVDDSGVDEPADSGV